MAGGRPKFKITPEVCKKAESLAAQGLNFREICLSLGISYQTFNEKRKGYSEFSDAIEAGLAKGVAQMSNALFQKGLAGDVSAQKFYLINRSPSWSDKQTTELTGKDGESINNLVHIYLPDNGRDE